MAKALVKQQGMEWAEVAHELYVSLHELRQILNGRNIIWSPDWITGVLRELRSPFDDPTLVRRRGCWKWELAMSVAERRGLGC